MKPLAIVGLLLIVLGVLALAYEGITYSSHKDVMQVGPIRATVETKKSVPLSPVLGGMAVVGGIVLVIVGTRKS